MIKGKKIQFRFILPLPTVFLKKKIEIDVTYYIYACEKF